MIYVIIALLICGGDLGIKYYIEKKRTDEQKSSHLGGHIVIEKSHNKGACLNFLEKMPNLVLGLSGIVLGILITFFALVLPKQRQSLLKLALAFTIGGAAGNFFDRIYRGYVVDYLNFPKIKKIKRIDFNVSDLFIFLGGFLLLLVSLFKKD